MSDEEMASGALQAIQSLLDAGGIPRGTFADDQVRNLVALYNQRGDALASAETRDPLPPVLDACCGPRAMWFERSDPRCLFIDKRRETHEMRHNDTPRSPIVIDPDILCDFTSMPFDNNAFGLVVFDPPHVVRKEALGNVTKFYGVLNGDWREMIRRGFEECFRVLSPGGVLIFKWTETQIPLRDILALTPEKPLFGHKSGAKARTHWCTFMKSGYRS